MELSHLGKRVGVTHRPSIEKAKEYQRLLGLKMPTTGPLGMVSAQADRSSWLGHRAHWSDVHRALRNTHGVERHNSLTDSLLLHALLSLLLMQSAEARSVCCIDLGCRLSVREGM